MMGENRRNFCEISAKNLQINLAESDAVWYNISIDNNAPG